MPIELLNYNKIINVIELENQNNLTRLEIFDSIESTSTYVLDQAKLGASSGLVCFAEQQSQGRGRRGRHWFSPPYTNIYCSILWHFSVLENISALSLAIAVMIANVLRKYGIVSGIELKWPNDVLFGGRKLAGILLERKDSAVVIGIGLNLYLPNDADPHWISMREIVGEEIKRNYLAGLLVNELLSQLPIYQTRGFGAFIADWRKQDVLINKVVSLDTPVNIFQGLMKGVNEQGELLLQDPEGQIQAFCYGEVSCRVGSGSKGGIS